MSNMEAHSEEHVCGGEPSTVAGRHLAHGEFVPVEIITSREVPLGGPRAMTVRRTLPQRKRSMVGPWCFVDHYGPDDVSVTGGMDVAPHPHTGLQTVSWLFSGEIEHHDSGGHTGLVRPGEVNLMTAGAGICHSEVSTEATTILHGVQLWLALPDSARNHASRAFEHYVPPRTPLRDENGEQAGSILVFLGECAGSRSPVESFSPVLGAELTLEPGARVELEVNPDFEHALLLDAGELTLEGISIERAALGYTGCGARTLHLENTGAEPARAMLLGGTPFGEEIVMWWNFIARSDEEIRALREEWNERTERFGKVEGYVGKGGPDRNAQGMAWLPAPTLPNAVIRPRKNPAPEARP
ncbi:pirin family protein [Corynebacterium sp.]|uniref:pirin family protein n=1 Tax=Corynebacterium sp. TaxID=1720 RepID=UPI0026DD4818|nr:pirin family protein [Corynebacterium sp.]MDO5032336.1 pirin family protein [Corynebacterium sp.]